MAKEADKPDVAGGQPMPVSDTGNAPIVFFDEAPNFANYNGIVAVTLSAVRNLPDGKGGVASDQVITAFLRTNINGALALRNAIDSALLLGAKTEGGKN